MFEIEVARHSGFCYGVKEAIDKATETAENSGAPTKTYGPLIHNPQEIERLRGEYGIESLSTLENFRDGNLVIRAHGVPPEDYERARANNLNIVDATCRFVVDVQDYAMDFCRKGYELFVVGDEHHAEVVGIVGHARKAYPNCVIHVVNDLQEILDKKPVRAAIVFQTTQEFTKYKKIERYIRDQKLNWKIKNTICGATKSNQYSADELARRVDLMLVIGGKNSGNTERLAEICAGHARTHHIETYSEIRREWLEGVKKIGITAGASTPQWLVDEVIEELEKIGDEQPLPL
ncbi:MAG: 4-hydroxy-3-methylbut-2-enyl diphosphate reductase [Nitrospirae bacterium]|nr:4-hydroxy-3-methylbut-2-enyl diphosphate reductase [Nitrospirota bacterium]